jgi:hypothetical protein
VLYVAEGRAEASLDTFWESLSEEQKAGVEAIAMDMWDPLNSTWRHLPEADDKIVFDKFHIAKHPFEAAARVRGGGALVRWSAGLAEAGGAQDRRSAGQTVQSRGGRTGGAPGRRSRAEEGQDRRSAGQTVQSRGGAGPADRRARGVKSGSQGERGVRLRWRSGRGAGRARAGRTRRGAGRTP